MWYEPAEPMQGECRLRPPVLILATIEGTAWGYPSVRSNSGCSEHVDKAHD